MRSSTRFVVALQALGLVSALPSSEHPGIKARDSNTYDYIIVGGGVTGLIVANRLTEDEKSGSDPRPQRLKTNVNRVCSSY